MIDPFINTKKALIETIEHLEFELARWVEKYGEDKEFVKNRVQDINNIKTFYNESLHIIQVSIEAEKPATYTNAQLREENDRLRLLIQSTGWDISDVNYIPRKDLLEMQRALSIDKAKANNPHLF